MLTAAAVGLPAQPAQAQGGGTTVLTVSAGRSGITGIPSSLPGGEYTFVVTQSGGNSLQLARLHTGYTVRDLEADIAAGFGKGDLAAIGRFYAGAEFEGGSGSAPKQQFTTYLAPGPYVYFNVQGPVTTFTVTEKGKTAPDPPRVGPTVAGYEDPAHPDHFGFDIQGAFPRSGSLRFKALGTDQPHFLYMSKLKSGATAMDCLSYQGPPGPKAPCATVFVTGVISPGEAIVWPYTLPGAGSYVIACFLPDPDKGGRAHEMLGMHAVVTVA